ncbi:hypothetical protein [Edaphobacter bradus]|uniref:hypothetical protein n=1 Tax=Edaphobacter bradus TaxID=2259016 RepID=UPI0021E046B3|nr:hypothetical protein [Edaphobacter bradus]
MRRKTLIAMLLALTPGLAFANSKTSSVHMRPQLFHDRSPRIHSHAAQPHHVSAVAVRAAS